MKNVNSEKLLNALGKNVSMAVQSLELILPEVSDEKFKEYLSKLNDEYSIVLTEAQMLAKANDMELKLTTPIEKAKLWTSIKLEMLMNKSTRKFATMIFLGTNMGIPTLLLLFVILMTQVTKLYNSQKSLNKLKKKAMKN